MPQTRASVPKISGQGQTLGGSSTGRGEGGGAGGDARSAAAKAAEVGDNRSDDDKGDANHSMDRLAPRFKKYPHPWAVMRI